MYVGVERCYPDNSIDTCFWQPRRYLQRRRRGVRAYIVVDLPRRDGGPARPVSHATPIPTSAGADGLRLGIVAVSA
jgi:hypothetical protein